MVEIKMHRILLITFFVVLFSGCATDPGLRVTHKKATTLPLPEREIVFQLDPYFSGGSDQIGFVNSDGSGLVFVTRNEGGATSIVRPAWMDDGSLLLFSHPANFIEGITQDGFRVKLENLWARNPSLIHGTNEMLVDAATDDERPAIKRIDLDTGEVLQTYQVGENAELITLGTNNFRDGQILYERWYQTQDDNIVDEIVILNTKDNTEEVVLVDNKYIEWPAFSPDGSWIAYTARDGIYLVRPDGSENHRIVKTNGGKLFNWPPMVSWSPDGKWIVYHRCIYNDTERCEYNVDVNWIYKYNIETGEEVILVEGGFNPYWRWVNNK